MSKVVYNACFGGFRLSGAAIARYAELSGTPVDDVVDHRIKRHDPFLVQAVEELGAAAGTRVSVLRIAEVPSGSRYRIDEYDGMESVETPDSYEWEIAP